MANLDTHARARRPDALARTRHSSSLLQISVLHLKYRRLLIGSKIRDRDSFLKKSAKFNQSLSLRVVMRHPVEVRDLHAVDFRLSAGLRLAVVSRGASRRIIGERSAHGKAQDLQRAATCESSVM